jgi:transposase-like protein
MKHKIKDKKAAVAELEKGASFLKIRRKYKVNPVTLKQWVDKYKRRDGLQSTHATTDPDKASSATEQRDSLREFLTDYMLERFRSRLKDSDTEDLKELFFKLQSKD